MPIQTCQENGHKWDDSEHSQCPYCPDKTEVINTQSSDGGSNNDKTAVMSDQPAVSDNTEVLSTPSASDRTAIHKPVEEDQIGQDPGQSGRKLVGWLVSFSWNKEGQDHQLREGKTTIGADGQCDITVPDGEVSGHHATILYRSETFRIKDEFSTNGTHIDGNEIVDQTELEDGNTITLGKTDFLFRRI